MTCVRVTFTLTFLLHFLPSLPLIFLPIIEFCQHIIMILSRGLAAVQPSGIIPFSNCCSLSAQYSVFLFPLFLYFLNLITLSLWPFLLLLFSSVILKALVLLSPVIIKGVTWPCSSKEDWGGLWQDVSW